MIDAFRIVSYNILANAYIKPEWYPRTSPGILLWETRKAALVHRLMRFDADILCLQEVESEAFTYLESVFQGKGYRGLFAQKSNKPDGSATFYRADTFNLLNSHAHYYHDGIGTANSGHLALIACFEWAPGRLNIANTHVKWDISGNADTEHTGYRQIKELLEEEVFIEKPGETWILAGDFNAQPDSPLVRLIGSFGLLDAYHKQPECTCNSNDKAKRIDYIFHSQNVIASPDCVPAIEDLTPLPSDSEPSDHLPISAEIRSRYEADPVPAG